MKASPPPDQARRLEALRQFDILDTPREKDFDEIVQLASRICEAPISVITLVEEQRQWFKAETGLDAEGTPLDSAICAHAILQSGLTIIPDTLEDARTADNPLCAGEPHLRFYAGTPLRTADGHQLGTLCVLDHKPRDLSKTQRMALEVLGRQVMAQIQLRKIAAEEKAARALADEKIAELEASAREHEILTQEVDHRVKNSLQQVAALLNIQTQTAPEDAARYLSTARDRVLAIAALHEQLHFSAVSDKVDIAAFLDRLVASIKEGLLENVTLTLDADRLVLDTKKASSVGIIINELVTNSIKHAFPKAKSGEIRIRCTNDADQLRLDISDTGVGMTKNGQSAKVPGLGMRVIRSSVSQLGGTMEQHDNAPGTRTSILLPLE